MVWLGLGLGIINICKADKFFFHVFKNIFERTSTPMCLRFFGIRGIRQHLSSQKKQKFRVLQAQGLIRKRCRESENSNAFKPRNLSAKLSRADLAYFAGKACLPKLHQDNHPVDGLNIPAREWLA